MFFLVSCCCYAETYIFLVLISFKKFEKNLIKQSESFLIIIRKGEIDHLMGGASVIELFLDFQVVYRYFLLIEVLSIENVFT